MNAETEAMIVPILRDYGVTCIRQALVEFAAHLRDHAATLPTSGNPQAAAIAIAEMAESVAVAGNA